MRFIGFKLQIAYFICHCLFLQCWPVKHNSFLFRMILRAIIFRQWRDLLNSCLYTDNWQEKLTYVLYVNLY